MRSPRRRAPTAACASAACRPAWGPTTSRSCLPRSWRSPTRRRSFASARRARCSRRSRSGTSSSRPARSAWRTRRTSTRTLDFPAVAHRDVVWALESACREQGVAHHVGLTATASGFYAPQGRAMRTLPVRYPELADELRRQRVANLEMESSALFVLAHLAGLRLRHDLRGIRAAHGWHVPGRRGKGGRGGTLYRCRAGRHPPAVAGRHRWRGHTGPSRRTDRSVGG